jgi:hypothetical protein
VDSNANKSNKQKTSWHPLGFIFKKDTYYISQKENLKLLNTAMEATNLTENS